MDVTEMDNNLVGGVRRILDDVMAVPVEGLERVVQLAHESTPKQKEDPPERFDVSRQCLRMFWHFRCNLEAVMPKEATV